MAGGGPAAGRGAGGAGLELGGAYFHEQAEQYKTDIYFLSPNGIDSHCISLSSRQEAIIKRVFIENANKVIVVADHSKFNRNAGNYLMDVEDVNEFISDTTIDG